MTAVTERIFLQYVRLNSCCEILAAANEDGVNKFFLFLSSSNAKNENFHLDPRGIFSLEFHTWQPWCVFLVSNWICIRLQRHKWEFAAEIPVDDGRELASSEIDVVP